MYKYIQPLFVISQSKNNIYAILIYTYTRDYANFVPRKSNIEYKRKRVINNIYLFSVKIVILYSWKNFKINADRRITNGIMYTMWKNK